MPTNLRLAVPEPDVSERDPTQPAPAVPPYFTAERRRDLYQGIRDGASTCGVAAASLRAHGDLGAQLSQQAAEDLADALQFAAERLNRLGCALVETEAVSA